MTKKLCWMLIAFGAVAVFLPLAIDWCIIGNNFPSNISNSEWVGFLGGYVGSVIGAIVSLIGIVMTIRFTNHQNKEDRELQIRPYCNIHYVPQPTSINTQKILGSFFLGCEPKENNGPRYDSVIYIKNIGIGPAIEFEIAVDDVDDGRKHYPIIGAITSETRNHTVTALQPGEEAAFYISVYFNFDPIPQNSFFFHDGIRLVKREELEKYRNFDLNIAVKYRDMYCNQYEQKIVLTGNMYVSPTANGGSEHKCDLCLQKMTAPIKIQARKHIKG